MRRIAFLLLLFPFVLFAQQDCDVFSIQGLAAENLALHDSIALFSVDSTILQSDGSYEVYLSNGTTYTLVQGCTNPAYVEYSASANTDDGSCATLIVNGCTSSAYTEYNASANTDDGSCATLIVNGCTSSAYTEYNASANTDDGSCATFVVNGCTDPAYVEYSASANTDDGSCVTLVVEGCTDAADSNYDPAANTDDGSCASNSCSSIEFDDYTYSVVEIGDQCWFAENLRSENYRNGDAIPSPIDFIWNQTSIGATRVYGESCGYCESYTTLGDACDPLSIEEFGRLYNWYAVTDPREVCPIGWHVSTDADWLQLEIHLGMSEEDASGTGYPRGSNEGFLLKSSLGWHDGANGSDAFGFKGLPAGIIQPSGHCGLAGTHTIFWTPHLSSELNVFGDGSPYNAERVSRQIRSTDEYITRSAGGNQRYGFSVRCVRDAE
ncbi:fibrobacter succinogenes major paralogous domain-containing protein [Flavobacteriales bacterium]|nr:fibrobacter succinogenes major paralogous domain-containing protein [Flavobacteriales bacterium]